MKTNNKGRGVLSVVIALAALGLGGCDWIQSLWKSEQPAPQAQQAPAEGKIEIAKAPIAPKPLEAPAADENKALVGKVKAALGADPALKLLAIDAGASDGVVTLYGTADNKASRDKAERIAAGVPGVKSVRNELVIVAGS